MTITDSCSHTSRNSFNDIDSIVHDDGNLTKQRAARLLKRLAAKETFLHKRILHIKDLVQRKSSVLKLTFLSKQLEQYFSEIEVLYERVLFYGHFEDPIYDDNWLESRRFDLEIFRGEIEEYVEISRDRVPHLPQSDAAIRSVSDTSIKENMTSAPAQDYSTDADPLLPTHRQPYCSSVSVDDWIDLLPPAEPVFSHMKDDTLPSSIDLISKAVANQNLPNLTIPSFDGTATRWIDFVIQFKDLVHDRVYLSGAQRMAYLMQSVQGEAKRSIQGLQLDWSGYVSALRRLKLMFGRKANIVIGYLNQITMGASVEDDDLQTLSDFYYSLSDCNNALIRLNHTSELYSSNLLGRVLTRLPLNLKRKWCEHSYKLRQYEEPSLLHLENWLRDRVMIQREPFMISSFEMNSNDRSCPVSQSNVNSSSRCQLCKNTHRLTKCYFYLQKSPQDRLCFVKSNNLCQICLKIHKLNGCNSKINCLVGDCGANHHTTLHDALNLCHSMASEKERHGNSSIDED